MKKNQNFPGVFFEPSTLTAAIAKLGPDFRVSHCSVATPDGEVTYDTLDEFLREYGPAAAKSMLSIRSEKCSLDFYASDLTFGVNVTVEAPTASDIDPVLEVFEQAAPSARRSSPVDNTIDLRRYCLVAQLNWQTLTHLAEHLKPYGVSVQTTYVDLVRYPDAIYFRDWEAALKDINEKGVPGAYTVALHGTSQPGNEAFKLKIQKPVIANPDEAYIVLELSNAPDTKMLDDVTTFLGLQADTRAYVQKSAFVAHRFDPEGEQVADRLARFLALIGFDVKTGRGFSPQPVGQKVKNRIEAQAVVFVVFTPGEDATWLTQESILAYAKEKPIIVLRDTRTDFKSGILADMEYIPFTAPAIEGAFISVLEGLKELGYLS